MYKNDIKKVLSILTKLVTGYKPAKKIVNWKFNENINKISDNI